MTTLTKQTEPIQIAEPRWSGPRNVGRPAYYQAGHIAYLGSLAASRRLGCTRRTLYKWAAKYPDELPGYEMGDPENPEAPKTTFYALPDIDNFRKKHYSLRPLRSGKLLAEKEPQQE